MSFPSSFGAQVAAIMDVLAKAAVAEITKLMEDGSLVLRLEMSRREDEIQELRANLKLIEAELREAQEAAASRRTEDRQAQRAGETPVLRDGKKREHLEPTQRTSFKKPEILTLFAYKQRFLHGRRYVIIPNTWWWFTVKFGLNTIYY